MKSIWGILIVFHLNMLDMYSFVCDLETKLNENKKILSSDEYVRPVRTTVSLTMNKDCHQKIISNVFLIIIMKVNINSIHIAVNLMLIIMILTIYVV